MKTQAPALERGIKVLETLSNDKALSLEEIAEKLKAPKSSLLRILETLSCMNLISKNETKKTYTALSAIVPISPKKGLSRQLIIKTLEEISDSTLSTAEWYLFDGTNMVITERMEAKNNAVHIVAKVGWKRTFTGELEAVARTAIAHGYGNPKNSSFWSYDSKGKKYTLSQKEVNEKIKSTLKDKCTLDQNYNSMGIRRYAAPVLGKQGELVGIMALAENFTPSADSKSAKKLETLKKITKQLSRR